MRGCRDFCNVKMPSARMLIDPKGFEKRVNQDELLRRVVAHVDRVEAEVEAALSKKSRLERLLERLFSGGKHGSFQTGLDRRGD